MGPRHQIVVMVRVWFVRAAAAEAVVLAAVLLAQVAPRSLPQSLLPALLALSLSLLPPALLILLALRPLLLLPPRSTPVVPVAVSLVAFATTMPNSEPADRAGACRTSCQR